MRLITVKDTEWTYPDRTEYQSAGKELALHSARNSYAASQVIIESVPENASVSISASGAVAAFSLEAYELVPVMVEDNANLNENDYTDYIPSRKAPYYLYDCAKPLGETLTPHSGNAGLYLAFQIPKDTKPGVYEGAVTVCVAGETFDIPTTLKVYSASIPDKERLKVINGFSTGHVAKYHGTEDNPEETTRLADAYLRMLRRARQNMLYVGGVKITSRPDENGNGEWAFDFSDLVSNVKRYISLGYQYFNMSSVGGRKSWKESTILVRGMPAMSYEAYRYLSAYLPALQKVLEENGWIDNFFMGVADEPNDANATEFRALCGLVRKLAPKIRLLDALSFTAVHGALDVWVPLNSEYEKHQKEFEGFRVGTDEIWMYVCCGPRGEGYINRFMDYPLLSTRYLFWGNYKYDLKGYLHWAANIYQPGQNPFEQNCPEHRNADSVCILPPGDTHIVYPGKGEPWMSLRLEAQRASAEDYELLCLIAERDKAKADAICDRGFKKFNNVDYDVNRFEETRKALLEAASELI